MTFNPLQAPPMPPSSLRHHHSAIRMRHNAHEMMERETACGKDYGRKGEREEAISGLSGRELTVHILCRTPSVAHGEDDCGTAAHDVSSGIEPCV